VVMMIAILSVAGSAVATARQAAATYASGPLVRVAELPEASGVAVSRRSPGRLWSHNDSGEAVLVGLDTRGAVTAGVRLSGVKVEDWEAVAVGACPGGSCIYIGDIGDNEAERKRITVHRVPEPSTEDSVVVKETFELEPGLPSRNSRNGVSMRERRPAEPGLPSRSFRNGVSKRCGAWLAEPKLTQREQV